MWICQSNPNLDPSQQGIIVRAECSIEKVHNSIGTFLDIEEKRVVFVAIADFFARRIEKISDKFELLETALQRSRMKGRSLSPIPYILERSDVFCSQSTITLNFHVKETSKKAAESFAEDSLNTWKFEISDLMTHIACCIYQNRLRQYLSTNKLIAFIADEAILPRKSGASQLPMTSPPAIPFTAPYNSDLRRTIEIDMGILKPFLQRSEEKSKMDEGDKISISGMAIPAGVTLIVGGGYHGKSTLLRTIAVGVYDKIPGDGREFCATVMNAVSVRAEDGRYVSNCNVSAFISNLPKLGSREVDVQNFSSNEASGSTSQAANVVEAIEMEASAMLIDEDVSAANFMARDGRMRALVMDESITPLLYRVNGLFQKHNISSIVVVGGVGDWLDVPHKVILMDKYVAGDATAKAKSISRQFSYGHVQYAGRGVVHRLEWDKENTPVPRRLTTSSLQSFRDRMCISLLEGGDILSIHASIIENSSNYNDADDFAFTDMSRCEQLIGRKSHLYGCGLCIIWILENSQKKPDLSIIEHLKLLQNEIEKKGFASINKDVESCIKSVGCAFRPRQYEIFMALARLRGTTFEEVPIIENDAEISAMEEERRKKEELAALWSSRRKKNRFQNL